jgi:ubiquinol-cytochrome c reductase cytochrome c1 subunit
MKRLEERRILTGNKSMNRKIWGAAGGLALAAALGITLTFLGSAGYAAEEPEPAAAAGEAQEAPKPARQDWSFYGPFGKFDQPQLQRGFQVYREVCSNCHSLKSIAFRNLADPGSPGFSEAQVKALAAEYKIKDGPNDAGEMFERPGRPSDYFPWTFANPQAARAALGALPPDMSVLAKARSYHRGFPLFLVDPIIQYQEHGADYIYALMNGYTNEKDPNWNEYMPGHRIAMPKPLSDGLVTYSDGSPQTVAQYSKDVVAFLTWAAEPKLEERKKTGFRVIIFLILFASLLYFVKKRIWADIGGH